MFPGSCFIWNMELEIGSWEQSVEERSGRSMELSWHNNTLRLEQTHDLTADRKLLETADRNYPTNVADIGQDLPRISFSLVLWEKFQNLQMDWMKLISRVEKLWRLAPSNNWQHLCEGNSLQTTSTAIRESYCPKLKWMLYLNRFPSQFIQQTHYKQVPTWNFCRKIILTTNIED